MTDEQITLCHRAIAILRNTPRTSPFYPKRQYVAEQIELQTVVGILPRYAPFNAPAVSLATKIVAKAG